nr:hypothetical protein [uncultured Rhodopila sp.]
MFARPLIFAALLIAVHVTTALAQPAPFACPKPGTVEERGVSTLKYTGTSPSDPYVCARLDPRAKPELRLFNLYALSDSNNTPAANAAVRAGLLDLLSGRKTSVSFPYTAYNGYIQQENWTLLRKEPYSIDGKTVETLVFETETTGDSRGTSGFHGRYTRWLDPKSGVWLKADLAIISGAGNFYPQAYRVRSVTTP